MSVLTGCPLVDAGVNLATTLTGNVDTTNTLDRGPLSGPALLRVVSTIGGAPTVKFDIQGSMDGTNFYNVPYALIATPETWVVTQITITQALTSHYVIKALVPWRYLKCVLSANNNVTLTVDIFPTDYGTA